MEKAEIMTQEWLTACLAADVNRAIDRRELELRRELEESHKIREMLSLQEIRVVKPRQHGLDEYGVPWYGRMHWRKGLTAA